MKYRGDVSSFFLIFVIDSFLACFPLNIKRSFFTITAVNACTAGLNMLSTILLIRWFGSSVYADFLIDLAYLALPSIFLEIVPSNYSIFRVQDEPVRIRGLAALAIITAIVLVCSVNIASRAFDIFNAYSIWIAPYAGLTAIKRYLDIRLQSTGRLREYFGIEFRSAFFRLIFMGIFIFGGGLSIKAEWSTFSSCFVHVNTVFTNTQSLKEGWLILKNCLPNRGTIHADIQPIDAVWASLSCAGFLSQVIWFIRRPSEYKVFLAFFDRSAWKLLFEERRAYVPYYLGIVLKRIRDNLIPILANNFFISRESLGAFFLAFRGLEFTLGQIRIIEGLLNHRQSLSSAIKLSFYNRMGVAFLSQLICITVSIALMFASGIKSFQILTIVVLSFVTWFNVFFILERAKAYSNYDVLPVNAFMVVYSSVLTGLVSLLITLGIRNEIVFSLILLCTEAISLVTMCLLKKDK